MIQNIIVDSRNRRIRVMHYASGELKALGDHLDLLAKENGAGKIILYARESDLPEFQELGWRMEGVMSGYFQGQPAFCLTRYPDPRRAVSETAEKENAIIRSVMGKKPSDSHAGDFSVRRLKKEDIDKVMLIFKDVFITYPSPIEERTYFEEIMTSDTYLMMAAEEGGQLAGIVSADIDPRNNCAEITDCVTLPAFRGRGVMGVLVDTIEKQLWEKGLCYLYSLTRAGIPPINAVFYRGGYSYTGRLINNCTMGGTFESMNIWGKIR